MNTEYSSGDGIGDGIERGDSDETQLRQGFQGRCNDRVGMTGKDEQRLANASNRNGWWGDLFPYFVSQAPSLIFRYQSHLVLPSMYQWELYRQKCRLLKYALSHRLKVRMDMERSSGDGIGDGIEKDKSDVSQ